MPRLLSPAVLAAGLATLAACQDRRPDVPTATFIETASATPATCADSAVFPVDTTASVVRWKGTKLAGRGSHEGTVRITGGHAEVCDGALAGGAFTIDMESIAVTDIPAHETVPRRRLTTHLRSDDFFAVDRYPTARLEILSVAPSVADSARVEGALTLRGQTRTIAFDAALVSVSPQAVHAEAQFGIDRQLWGVAFTGSELTNDLVDDIIFLEVRLHAQR